MRWVEMGRRLGYRGEVEASIEKGWGRVVGMRRKRREIKNKRKQSKKQRKREQWNKYIHKNKEKKRKKSLIDT